MIKKSSHNTWNRNYRDSEDETTTGGTLGLHVSTKKSYPSCIFCGEQHGSYKCPDVKKFTVDARIKAVKKVNACTNCLRRGHEVRRCRFEKNCKQCEDKHSPLLCPKNDNVEGNGQVKKVFHVNLSTDTI